LAAEAFAGIGLSVSRPMRFIASRNSSRSSPLSIATALSALQGWVPELSNSQAWPMMIGPAP
jgi:hypothetical protein